MDYVAELLNDLQHAITQGERHAILAVKVQNIRAELVRAEANTPTKEAEDE